jgi:signal peptidase I
MKVFLFASFKVPTGSMEPVILSGDFVLVNKLLIGPRIYQNFGFLRGQKTPFTRIRGLNKIRRNDILVFDMPYIIGGTLRPSPDQCYVKRCIAIPGDTFSIENGFYKIKGYPESLGNYPNQLLLSQTEDKDFESHVFHCFPDDRIHSWNIKNFGPFYVPGKGDIIELNPQIIVLYKSLIQYETGKRITVKEGRIFLDQDTLPSYTFTRNYYFMTGDYVAGSYDSRYWGLLPEDFVVGKVVVIWKSEDPETGRFRWKWFLKIIR